MEKKHSLVKYFWEIIYANTIAYVIAVSFALLVMNHRFLYADGPTGKLGLFWQIFRGIIIALVLLPLRKIFFEEKHGLIKLGLIIIGLSLSSNIWQTNVEFTGCFGPTITYEYLGLGFPEAIIYVLLFIGILKISIKYKHKKIITILSIIIMLLIWLMGIMVFIMA